METEHLIETLAHDLAPVRRLRPAWWRLAAWLALALVASAIVVAFSGLRPDLAARFAERGFLVQELAALVTALVAGWAALAAGVPGTPRWALWTPLAPLAWWLATLGQQCWQVWSRFGGGGQAFDPELECLLSIVLVAAIPAVAILVMIRRGARLHASFALGWGTLAAISFASAGHLLFHAGDATVLGLVVQVVATGLLAAGAIRLRKPLLPNATAAPR